VVGVGEYEKPGNHNSGEKKGVEPELIKGFLMGKKRES